MSNMAADIAARMAADGFDPASGGPAPGTDGGGQVPPQDPPAEAQNTVTPDGGTPPDTIPYARFKEVNDRLQGLVGYEELQRYGYDPDSLGRLASFEAQYMNDPLGTWLSLAGSLELPQEVKDALSSLGTNSPAAPTPGPGAGSTPDSQPQPQTAQLPQEVQEKLRYVDELRAERESAAQEALVDEVLRHWTAADEAAGVKTPNDYIKLLHINGVAGRGGYANTEELAKAARDELMGFRDEVLGSAVQRSGPSGSPPAVLGGGSPPAPPAQGFGGDIKKATAAAMADLRAGRLPT